MGLVRDRKKRHVLPSKVSTQPSNTGAAVQAETPPKGLPPGLWVVATPIGNLSDISERAREALSRCSRILCEDTRRSAQLIQALGLTPARPPRLERMDAYVTEGKLQSVLSWLEAGENLALVTDAGTPAISDPGAELVKLAHEAGIQVTPVPGPSAVTALLSVSGFGQTAFSFRGFFPRKPSERLSELQVLLEVSSKTDTLVHLWFESPQRIEEALEAVVEGLGELAESTRICAAKEITKAFEKVFEGSAPEVLSQIREHVLESGLKGEWCFAILLPPKQSLQIHSDESSDWVKALHCFLDEAGAFAPVSASEAARRVSQHFGAPKKLVYEKALQISGKKI
jgi:16S rRNA (cytidine1402-2'-O)-methyltransferase